MMRDDKVAQTAQNAPRMSPKVPQTGSKTLGDASRTVPPLADRERFCADLIRALDELMSAPSIKAILSGSVMALDAPQKSLMAEYALRLVETNQVMNLTSITDPAEIALKHFIDSLTILPELDQLMAAIKTAAEPSGRRRISLVDVGTGAGFPGLPLKILRPDIELTLMDSLAKRVHFLEETAAALGLNGVRCIHVRAEDAGRDHRYRESFDIAVARAVAPLPVLCEYCLPLTRVGGLFIAMKADVTEELTDGKRAAGQLGGQLEGQRSFDLVDGEQLRTILTIRKKEKTPAAFPRSGGKPRKKPL